MRLRQLKTLKALVLPAVSRDCKKNVTCEGGHCLSAVCVWSDLKFAINLEVISPSGSCLRAPFGCRKGGATQLVRLSRQVLKLATTNTVLQYFIL